MMVHLEVLDQNTVVVYYHDGRTIRICSDDNTAVHMADCMLSPRPDMTLSDYMRLLFEEDTQITEAA